MADKPLPTCPARTATNKQVCRCKSQYVQDFAFPVMRPPPRYELSVHAGNSLVHVYNGSSRADTQVFPVGSGTPAGNELRIAPRSRASFHTEIRGPKRRKVKQIVFQH